AGGGRRPSADNIGMRIRAVALLFPALLFPALTLAGCAASSESTESTPPATYGIDCPECFTIIEFVRGSPRTPNDRLQMRCELCCEMLTFTTDSNGGLTVATSSHQAPLPCELCAPAR